MFHTIYMYSTSRRSRGQFFMGAKLFIRIPKHLHSSDAMENM